MTFGSGFTVLMPLEQSVLEPVQCFGIQEAVGGLVVSASWLLVKAIT